MLKGRKKEGAMLKERMGNADGNGGKWKYCRTKKFKTSKNVRKWGKIS
jgi:hypothetical protein